MTRKLLAAALAAGFGMAAIAQQPGKTGGRTADAATGTPTPGKSSSPPATGIAPGASSTAAPAGADLVRAELDNLTSFIDTLVEEFQIEFQTEQEAQMFVLAATHFYLTAKLQTGPAAGGRGGRSHGGVGGGR